MKKQVTLTTSKCIMYIGNGVGWIAYAVFSIFDNPICAILGSIFLLMAAGSNFAGLLSSKQQEDEMSQYHLAKAKSVTMDWLKIIICVILVFLVLMGLLHEFFPIIKKTVNINLGLIIPLLLGITEIMTGVLFAKYERDGE